VTVLRPLQDSDLDAVIGVYREAWGESRPIDAAELRSWLRHPEIDPGSLRVLDVGVRVAGYGDITVADGVVVLEVAAPDHWDCFLAWAEATARDAGAKRVRVVSYRGDALPSAATSRGYFLWRSAYTMCIDFDHTSPATAPSPPGVALRAYCAVDDERLRNGINEVFRDDPFFTRLSSERFRGDYLDAPGMDPDLWVLAWEEEELAGFALGFAAWHGVNGSGAVKSVGVRPAWRRRGLGQALVRSAFVRLHARGVRRVLLGVDASNETAAVRLYERVGMRIVQQADNWALDL
jgi:mycothiol synthase